MDKEKRELVSKFAKEVAIGLLLFSLFLIPFVKDLEEARYCGDESGWIGMGLVYYDLLVKRDLKNPLWQRDFGSYSLPNPPVGKYIIGAGARKFGPNETFFVSYSPKHDLRWNIAKGMVPSPPLRYAAQLPITILAALTCLLVFYIGRELVGWKTGLLAAILLVFNPIMRATGRMAMLDVPTIFFETFAVLIMIFLLRSIGKRGIDYKDQLPLSIFAGLVIGLAVSTKLSGIIANMIFIAFLLVLMGVLAWKHFVSRKGDMDIKRLGALLIVTLVIVEGIAVAVFIAANPFLYPDPVGRTSKMLGHWEQKGFPVDGIPDTGDVEEIGVTEKVRLMSKMVSYWLPLSRESNMPSRLNICPGIPPKFPLSRESNISAITLTIAIVLFGIALLVYTESGFLMKENLPSPGSVVIIWVAVAFVGVSATLIDTRITWDRYYLPLAPPISVVMAYSFARMYKVIFCR